MAASEIEVVERLARVAEYRDDATGAHIRRVGKIVEWVALELGCSESSCRLMGKAALLHDLGKIAIPDSILLKPGQLTDAEFDEIKTHTRIGAEILAGSRSPVLKAAESIARFHHERWNGTGYEGLMGGEIPLGARITAVADVYDALRNVRPYKGAWPHRAAMEEIERLSGIGFDPDVVGAFVRIQADLQQLYREGRISLAA